MDAGQGSWRRTLFVVALVGGLGLAALLALSMREVYAPRGDELLCESVGFRVLDVSTAELVGAPGSGRAARGLFRIVRLEVVNHDDARDSDLASHHPLLIDDRGRVSQVDAEATRALRGAERQLLPEKLGRAQRGVTPLAYDLPDEARGLTLRIAWELAALPNLVDQVLHGDRRLLLEPR